MICTCCQNEKDNCHVIQLPQIGYGGPFDICNSEDAIRFRLCDDCTKKVNTYILSKGISLLEFWKFNIVKTDKHLEHFEYEDVLWKVLHKFVPQTIDDIHLSNRDRLFYLKMAYKRHQKRAIGN